MKKVIVVIVSVLMLAVIVAAVLKKNNMLNKESIEKVVKIDNEKSDDTNNVVYNDNKIKKVNGDISRYKLNERLEVMGYTEDSSITETYAIYQIIEKVERLKHIDLEYSEKDGVGYCFDENGDVKDNIKLYSVIMKLENPSDIRVYYNKDTVSIVDNGAEYNIWDGGNPEFTTSERRFERIVGESEYTIRTMNSSELWLEPGEIVEIEIVYDCDFDEDGSVLVNTPTVRLENYEGISVIDLK